MRSILPAPTRYYRAERGTAIHDGQMYNTTDSDSLIKSSLPKPIARQHTVEFRLFREAEVSAFPDLKYVVEGVLPEGSFAEMHAPPASLKSFLAIDLAGHVATGRAWNGRSVAQGPVVYVAAEGRSGMKARLAAWKEANDVEQLDDAFFLFEPLPLLDSTAITRFVETLGAQGIQPKLVVVDTLARCFGGGDENSAAAMGTAVEAIRQVQQTTGAAVLVIHHSRKADGTERGSGALRAAADVMIALQRSDDLLTVVCDKMKEAEHFPDMTFRLRSTGDSAVIVRVEGADRAPRAGEQEPLTRREQDFLDALPSGVMSTAEMRAIARDMGITGGTYNRVLESLIREQKIERVQHGLYQKCAPRESTNPTSLEVGVVDISEGE